MSENDSGWLPKILKVGIPLSIISFGYFTYQYFRKTVEPKKTKKKITQEEPEQSLEEFWLHIHNLKEAENWQEIKNITEKKKDLLSHTFFAECLKHLGDKEQSFKILTNITKMEEPTDKDDIFAIGRAHQCLGNYDKAFEYFMKAAELNQTFAHFSLGIYYQNGIGMKEKDVDKSMECFKKSAETGDPASLYMLAITMDGEKAFQHLEKAAELNYLPAIITLAEVYLNQDKSKAFQYFMKACEFGHPKAELNVGIFYSNGEGVEKNEVEAFHWVEKSAEKGNEIAMYVLGGYLKMGMGCEKNINKGDEYIKKSSDRGFAAGQYMVATKLLKSDKDENLDEAVRLLELAAGQGHEGAMKLIDELVIYGDDDDYETDDENKK